MESVRVFSPATVANMGCGFDAMGFAFEGAGDIISMRFIDGDSIVYKNLTNIDVPMSVEENLMTPALRSIMDYTGGRRGVEVVLEQKIVPGSGIGSSASAATSAVYAYSKLIEVDFSESELIDFALNGEMMASGARHADNVAPAMMGGIVLIRENTPLDIIKIKAPEKLMCVVVHPLIEVKTKESRAILPKEMALKDAIRQWANVGALVAALYSSDYQLLGRALKDRAAEPYRKKFIAGYDELKESVMTAGALGANISGSGPSVFALCDSEDVSATVVETMKKHFERYGIPCDCYCSYISDKGCRVI